MLNYRDWLYSELVRIAKDNDFDDYKFYVFDQQDFTKSPQINEKKSIFVIIKHLSTSIMYNAEVRPLQLYIMSEENGLQIASVVFKLFANKNNWIVTNEGDDSIKHQYSDPVVLNNFNAIGTGYRSVLFISSTLYVIKNVVDVDEITIDGEKITPINFSTNMTIATDTQPFPDSKFAKSVRTSQTKVFTMTIPPKTSAFLTKVLRIDAGLDSGDTRFELKYHAKGVNIDYTHSVIVSGISFVTAPSDVPAIQIGLVM